MGDVRTIVELERLFDRYTEVLEQLPWNALKIRILDFLRQEIGNLVEHSQRNSFYQELVPHLLSVSQSPDKMRCQDPRIIDRLLT